MHEGASNGFTAGRVKAFGELGRAILLRSGLYAVLLFVLLEGFQGSVDYAFLAVMVFVVTAMHEALHMIGMEALGSDHSESFRLLAIGYASVNLSYPRVFLAVVLPFIVLMPFGALLTLTAIQEFVAVGWSIIILHAVLLPIEIGTIRSNAA